MKHVGILFLLAVGCGSDAAAPDAALQVRVPADRRLFQSITTFALRAERDGRLLAQQITPANGSTLSLGGVPFGQRTIFTLDGFTSANDLVARGSSCPMDFEQHGDPVVIYFSPVNFFAPTPSPPNDTRMFPVALPLATGSIVIAGGQGSTGAVMSAEVFSPVDGKFVISGAPLTTPRVHAEIIAVPGVGGLVVGGQSDGPAGDLYDVSSQAFVPVTNTLLIARTGHRMVTKSDGQILIIGGRTVAGVPTNETVGVDFTGNAPLFTAGPTLIEPRELHAAALVASVPVVFGGSGSATTARSIEVLPLGANVTHFDERTGVLAADRVGATATPLQDGTVLIVGGTSDLACGAELFNPVLGQSTCVLTADLRVEHTATLLPDGRVLVTGGADPSQQPLSSVELYVPSVGFVAERPLVTARHGHVAVPLCDGTVLVTGGGPGAEIYNPPASN
jgi:hypothetical protein